VAEQKFIFKLYTFSFLLWLGASDRVFEVVTIRPTESKYGKDIFCQQTLLSPIQHPMPNQEILVIGGFHPENSHGLQHIP